jgi:acyl-CoA thioesterase
MYFSDFVILDAPARLFDLHVGMPVLGDPVQGPDKTPDLEFMSSLNHVVHVHDARGFQANEWMFVEIDSPWASGGRSMGRSRIFTRDEKLVATCVQEVSAYLAVQ